MTFTFKLSRRIARLRAPVSAAILLTLAGCSGTDSVEPSGASPADAGAETSPAFATAFAGGIPFGTSAQPISEFGERYNGALLVIWPGELLSELSAIKGRGGRVVLSMAGNEKYYKDASGHFSMTKWKQRIDRYKGVNFDAYVKDGTIIGHYLIDEPNDPTNWNGQPIPGSMVEEMAKYSKQLWPGMTTIVRAEPSYFSGTYQYLDAAWAQYLDRRGDVGDYIRKQVADAQSRGLGLVVGLNVIKGANGGKMTGSQIETWGSALLSSSYPCAFISWQYNADYLSSSGIRSAMDALRAKAENRSTRSCGAGVAEPPPPASEPPPPSEPSPTVGALPFGLSLAPASEYSTRWTGMLHRATPADVVQRLGSAQNAGMRIIVQLASKGQSRNSDGTFNLTKWKGAVDRYRGLPLGGYISNGTFYLHHLVDQPNCASCWGGKAIPWSTLEEMARYSKSIWPALPTVARVTPTALRSAGFRWSYLDAGWAQYSTRQGDPGTWLSKQAAQAGEEGLGLVLGLNLLDGGSSGSMTASQIKQFGTILARAPSACALVGWSYDAGYLGQNGIREALDSVVTVARRRNAGSCIVS
jgi:hypothetical protein